MIDHVDFHTIVVMYVTSITTSEVNEIDGTSKNCQRFRGGHGPLAPPLDPPLSDSTKHVELIF